MVYFTNLSIGVKMVCTRNAYQEISVAIVTRVRLLRVGGACVFKCSFLKRILNKCVIVCEYISFVMILYCL